MTDGVVAGDYASDVWWLALLTAVARRCAVRWSARTSLVMVWLASISAFSASWCITILIPGAFAGDIHLVHAVGWLSNITIRRVFLCRPRSGQSCGEK